MVLSESVFPVRRKPQIESSRIGNGNSFVLKTVVRNEFTPALAAAVAPR